MTKTKRRLLKLLLWFVVILVLLGAAVLTIGQYWVIPAVIRSQVRGNLQKSWDGDVEVGEVDFSFFGPIELERLELSDSSGRKWFDISGVKIELRDWPSASPVLSKCRISKIDVQAYVKDGKCQWPFIKTEKPAEKTDLSKYIDIEAVTIDKASVAAVWDTGKRRELKDLRLEIKRQSDDGYNIDLTRRADGGSRETLISGEYLDKGKSSRVSVQMARNFTGDEVETIATLMKFEGVRAASGRIDLDVSAAGDFAKPSELKFAGKAVLSDWSAALVDGPLVQALNATCSFKGDVITVDSFLVSLAGGTAKGNAAVQLLSGNRFTVQADLIADSIDVAAISERIRSKLKLTSAAGKSRVVVSGFGNFDKLEDAEINGTVDLDDWAVAPQKGPAISALRVRAKLLGRKADVTELAFNASGGSVAGNAILNFPVGGDLKYSGTVTSRQVNLSTLARSFSDKQTLTKGILDSSLQLSGTGEDFKLLLGNGDITISGADIYSPPLMAAMLKGLGLVGDMRLVSEADVRFSIEGEEAVIRSAEMRGGLMVIRSPAGGRINLQNGNIDLQLAVVPAGQLKALKDKWDLAEIIGVLAEKLSLFRVTGNWKKSESIKVRPIPLQAVGGLKGTDVLDVIIKTDGKIGDRGAELLKRVLETW